MDCNQGSESANKLVKKETRTVLEMKNEQNDNFSAANGNGVSVFMDGKERGEKHEGMNASVLICSQDCDKIEEIKGNGTMCVNQESIGGDAANVDEKRNREFSVGDLVWGKIKSHPWWPGLIYDPSDASDFASKFKNENKLLVAYFGDGSCAWCSRAQLVPFVEHYEKMSKQSASQNFVCAVEEALEELGRRAELKMICSCVPEVSLTDLVRPEANNAGVRSGILVPNGGIDKLTSLSCEPADLLEYVRKVGQAGPLSNLHERVLMKSWLSAFSRVKRGCCLPVFREPQLIEGLEDKSNIEVPDSNDFSVPIAVPIQGPFEEELDGSTKVLPVKGLIVTPAKKRKLKNVAELMIEDKCVNLEGKKADAYVSCSTVSNDGTQIERVKDEITQKNEDLVDDVEEDSDENTLRRFISRKRKDSKYLSAPYTIPTTKLLRSYSKREVETKSDKIVKSAKVGERLMKVAGQLISSPHLIKCNGADSEETMSGNSLKLGPHVLNSQEINEKTTDNCPIDISASANQVYEGVLSAGVDPMSIDRSSIEPLKGFMSAFRSSVYSSKSKTDAPRSRVTKLKKVARSAAAKKKEVNKTAQDAPIISFGSDVSPVDFVQQIFMDLTPTLNQCDGKISAEEKSSLESEIRSMLQKVGELAVKASS